MTFSRTLLLQKVVRQSLAYLTKVNCCRSCCGSVGRVVSSDTRVQQFESYHWQNFIQDMYLLLIKLRETGMALFKKDFELLSCYLHLLYMNRNTISLSLFLSQFIFLVLAPAQCDQIGRFLKEPCDKYSYTNSPQYQVTFWAILKTCSFLDNITMATFGATLWGNWGTCNYKIWSHCSQAQHESLSVQVLCLSNKIQTR